MNSKEKSMLITLAKRCDVKILNPEFLRFKEKIEKEVKV